MGVLIIAEAGVNHNGDLGLARELVSCAADAGADIVKFQSFIAGRSISVHAPKAQYQAVATGVNESQLEMVRKLELSRSDHEVIVDQCRQKRIKFLSTAFDVESFHLLVQLGMDLIKIPSGELTNLPFLRHIGSTGKPVILSTGMANLGEVETALEVLVQSGTPRAQIALLHCSTEYPTPMVDVNLLAMRAMKCAFGLEVGYSDHTLGIEVPIAAVALGATIIEKHFTISRSLPGPDHQASLEPLEMKAMVEAIRNIEQALGDGIKRPSKGEISNRSIARKSLVAARAIRAGERFSSDNITAKRPGTGISPMRWDDVIGREASRNFAADELIVL